MNKDEAFQGILNLLEESLLKLHGKGPTLSAIMESVQTKLDILRQPTLVPESNE